jgi:protein-tyrosine-phosphatase
MKDLHSSARQFAPRDSSVIQRSPLAEHLREAHASARNGWVLMPSAGQTKDRVSMKSAAVSSNVGAVRK